VTVDQSLELTTFEVSSGLVVGRGARRSADGACQPIEALDAAVRASLRRSPCIVSFSGGHDSSLILATAARVARADGLPLPIPVTWRFEDAPLAEESAVQEAVIASLRLPDWVKLQARDDLDLVGPVARSVLLRHGLRFPANAFLHAPIYQLASGGDVLTGIGGDQIFGRSRRPRRPWPFAPRRSGPGGFGWLRADAARGASRRLNRERRRMPRSEVQRPRWRLESRRLELGMQTATDIARAGGASVVFPLADAALLASIERTGLTAHSSGGRAGLLAALFGEHLPAACLAPRRKATFNEVFWRRHSREHAASWTGSGINERLVDSERLADLWRADDFIFQTALLVQQTWLAQHASSVAGVRHE
jgi:asparagine synthetase B (glutamine-hydrolysing)